MKTILDLCGGTGAWSKPYKDNGYDVMVVDKKEDVRLIEFNPKLEVYGILSAPPCTHLSGSGARWWKGKGKDALIDALSIVDACLRAVSIYQPTFWCLENPVGRLSRYLGKPVATFQPYEYGDPYTKRTCLWGKFNMPVKAPVEPVEGGKMWKLGPSPERAMLRSITPEGFANSFFEANSIDYRKEE